MPPVTIFKGQPDGIAKKSTATTPELTGDNVLVRITASGVCGTDLHYRRVDMVLGHEGVGVVEDVGPNCHFLKKGDRVGWGYEVDSCRNCLECLSGAETYCADRAIYGDKNLDQGSFASHAVWSETFLHPTPDGLSDAAAAPLQCGGATTFAALDGAKPKDTIGVLGIGGLGHLAIQFAAKMGCRVVVFSSTDRKKDEARKLGAHEFVATKGATELKVSTQIDRLLVTAAVPPNWDLILPTLASRAVIYPLTVNPGNFEIPYMSLILQGLSVQGALVASRNHHRQMLAFAALHNIEPIVQKFPMTEEGIKDAMEKLDKGQVYYRAVLVPEGS